MIDVFVLLSNQHRQSADERFVFNIELPLQNTGRVIEPEQRIPQHSQIPYTEEYWQRLEEELRAFLIRISLCDAQLPSIKSGRPFQILLHVKDPLMPGNESTAADHSTAKNLRIQSQLDENSEAWITADPACMQLPSQQHQVVALRSMSIMSPANNHEGSQRPFSMELLVEAPQT